MNKVQASAIIETFNVSAVIDKLGFITKDNSEYELDTFVDQDGHAHVVLKSSYLDTRQLADLYTSTFGSGDRCVKRSRLYNTVRATYPEGTSFITIGSVLQALCFGPADMKLVSAVTAWTDGIY